MAVKTRNACHPSVSGCVCTGNAALYHGTKCLTPQGPNAVRAGTKQLAPSSTYSARSNAEDHTALTGWLCHSLQSVMQVPDWHVREGVMVNKEGLWVFKTELWSDSARTEKRVCFDMV